MALRESDLQIAVFTWAQTMLNKHPELKWMHAVPNGGYRDGKEAVGLKLQGVKAGILDIHLPFPRSGYHGCMIELKKPSGKCLPPSKEQSEYMEFLKNQGYYCFISNDFEKIKANILGYLNGN